MNSFNDHPWSRPEAIEMFMQEDLDHRFILALRDPGERFDSIARYRISQGRKPPGASEREQVINEGRLRHNQMCCNLARKHGKKLLEIDVTSDHDAGRRIADFPDLDNDLSPPFPHSNPTLRASRDSV